MNDAKNAKLKANELLSKYKLPHITLENLIYIIEKQGFSIVEYSKQNNTTEVLALIEELKIQPYIASGQAFTYVCGDMKMVFLYEDLSASEKLFALAHEEGHIACGHLNNSSIGNIESEHEANEFAHYLLHPSLYRKVLAYLYNHKKATIMILIAVVVLTISLFSIAHFSKVTSYHGEYYVSSNGNCYHQKDCLTIVGKKGVRRLTTKDYGAGTYDPCKVCLPN